MAMVRIILGAAWLLFVFSCFLLIDVDELGRQDRDEHSP